MKTVLDIRDASPARGGIRRPRNPLTAGARFTTAA